MKRFITCCALLGLVVLTACSGDSPSPRPLPTPAANTWAIPSLSVSDANPYVGVGVYVTATVTRNGSAAPDGTQVEFLATGGVFYSFDGTRAVVATEEGSATVLFGTATAGNYGIQARVVDAYRQVTVTYREHDPSDALQIVMPLLPSRGDRYGGEQVTLNGKGIVPPAVVTFILRSAVDGDVDGDEFEAVTVAVEPSEPLSAEGTITVQTPEATTILDGTFSSGGQTVNRLCASYEVDVKVEVGVGTSGYQTATYPEAFTYDEVADPICDPALQPECPPAPEVYLVVPDHGASAGGEQVTILGREFGKYWDDDAREFRVQTVGSVQVDFISPTRTLRGIEPVVSPDGHQISVTTPRYGAVPLDEDVVVDVKVTSLVDRDPDVCGSDELSDTKTEAFVFNADEPTPEILAIAPTAGPIDGGTVVTIFGHGFQFPVQVMFIPPSVPPREATVIEVNDDTSAADNDTIIVQTPTFADSGLVPPFTVDVEVTNVSSGKDDTLDGAFTYGANLYISGNTPTRGGRGTVVTIYGNGFEDPLQVDFLGAGTIRLETVAVSGTEVIARFPDDETPECQDTTATFRITLTEQPPDPGVGVVEGGSFTYLGLNPVVISVDPPIVQETLGGAGVTPMEVDVYGQRFTDEALVRIDGYTIPSQYVFVENDTKIHVSQLPSPNDFNLVWDTSTCVTPQGQNGTRRVATPVEVTVTNIPGECSDTLTGGLVYEPQTSECTVGAEIVVDPPGPVNPPDWGTISFESAPHGNCSPPVTVTITADSAADLEIQTMNLVGRFFFWNGGLAGQSAPGLTVPAFGTTTVDIVFCPDINNNLDYDGVFVIRSNAATDPYEANLLGTEMEPIVDATPAILALSTGTPVGAIGLANTGDWADWTAVITGTDAGEFDITGGATGSLAALIGTGTVQVTFTNPSGAGSYTANVVIDWFDPDNPSQAGAFGTITIPVTGTNP